MADMIVIFLRGTGIWVILGQGACAEFRDAILLTSD